MSKQKSKVTSKPLAKPSFFDKIEKKYTYIIAVAIILIPLIYTFSPYLFQNLRPIGTDIVASQGETNLYLKWSEQTGERALWNPNIFSGMPAYQRVTPQILHFDSLIWILDKFSYWAFWYFLVGALGMFFLLVYKEIPWQFSVIVAIAFILLPDWQAHLGDGHFTKLRAIMVLPWLVLTFNYFFDKNNWFGAAAFSFMFAWMFRTQHFQIVFYAILLLFILFIYPFLKLFIEKEYKRVFGLSIKFAAAIILTVVTAAQPFLSMNEYSPFSTRGGNPLKIGNEYKTAVETGGVDLVYATRWSLAPAEIMDFFVQRLHGGLSSEIYDGERYSQYKGQQIPGYWGEKPFSGNYAYFGMILFVFAVLGITKNYKDSFVLSLGVFVLFSLLLAFGRHIMWFYELFYYYVPYFSKFRAPAMIANITFIALLILSGYGLKSLLKMKHPEDTKILVSILGSAILFVGAILLFKDSFAYMTPAETGQYSAETLDVLKDMRKEFLTADTTKLLLIMVTLAAATLGLFFRKIKKDVFAVIILVLVVVELFPANRKAFEKINLDNEAHVEETVFQENELTTYLKGKRETERLLVLGSEFTSNHYSYFHPTINGYSAIKMQSMQDIVEHVLYNANTKEKINWNVINMLNGKYIILEGILEKDFLIRSASSPAIKQILYENTNVLPKAWLVTNIKQLNTPEDIAFYMNDSTFNPAKEALLLNKGSLKNTNYSGIGSVTVEEYSPNRIKINTETEEPQFMVLSELYYPAGWKTFVNNSEVEIHRTNHLLRGIEIPAGNNKVEFVFEPTTYYTATTMSWAGNFGTLLLILVFGYFTFIKRSDES